MNLDAGNVNVFVEGRAGAAFVLWICLGMGVAAAAALLLPWPPSPADSLMVLLVFGVLGAVVWQLGGQREIGFERATRTVVERTAFAGLSRERRLVVAGDASVEVTQKTIKVAKPGTDTRQRTSTDYDARPHYRLALRSGPASLPLDILPDVLEAERRAGEVAAILGVIAVRSGYSLDVERVAAGTASSADTRQIVTVRTAQGVQSAIVAAP